MTVYTNLRSERSGDHYFIYRQNNFAYFLCAIYSKSIFIYLYSFKYIFIYTSQIWDLVKFYYVILYTEPAIKLYYIIIIIIIHIIQYSSLGQVMNINGYTKFMLNVFVRWSQSTMRCLLII